MQVGKAVTALLAEGGVRRVYTVPGESFLEILDGVERDPRMRLVSTRHESGASFMGDADAKMTGRPAVVAGTRGVGASNLAIGIHTAFQDSTPMVALLGQVETRFLGREGFQEVDLPQFFGPIAKWATTAEKADRVPELVAKALRVAQSGRPGPVMIAFPSDVLGTDIAEEEVEIARRAASAKLVAPAADPQACAYVEKRLREAARPVIVAGGGARSARHALVAVAEGYSAGVYSAFRRQDVFPNDHPLYVGHLGLGVGGDRLDALVQADFVLVVGCRLSEITTAGYTLPPSGVEINQVDVDWAVLGSSLPISLGVVATAESFLESLSKSAGQQPRPTRDWTAAREAYERSVDIPPSRARVGVDPAQVVRAMLDVYPPDTVLANDAGNFSAFLHQHWRYRAPLSQVAPTSGAMGYGVPGTIGAKIAAPERTVVGLCGDGGFTMTAQEVETAVREGVEATVIVMCNRLYGTIAMHQARATGRLAGVNIGPIDVAGVARSYGANGFTVDSEEDLVTVFKQAQSSSGFNVVEVMTDPDVISPSALLSDLLEEQSRGHD